MSTSEIAVAQPPLSSLRSSSSDRIPELDGLRGLAILLVIICHYIANAAHAPLGFFLDHLFTCMDVGWSGVDLFFVLSGFLIGGILLDARRSPRYFQTFYLRRAHRILPIYYVWLSFYVITAGAIVFLVRSPVYILPEGIRISASDLRSVPHYFLFLQNVLYGPTRFEWIWLAVTWSLAVEEQFYLVAPPLVRYLSARALIIALCSTIVLAPFLRYFAFVHWPHLDHFYQFAMPCRADALSLGILAAIAWRWEPFHSFLNRHPALLQRAVVYLGLAVFCQLWWLVRPLNLVTITIGYTTFGFLYVSLLLLVLSQTSSMAARLARVEWLRILGGISYGTYLIHLTINELGHRILLQSEPRIYDLKGVSVTAAAVVVTIVIATLSWKFFERPLVRRGHRFKY
jgi:peptidoglycan/LPS O-acetylase OafA/YrhL